MRSETLIDPKIRHELERINRELEYEGKQPSRAQLAQYFATFRERFGPERLNQLDGEALLEYMHLHGNHDSLVYWLEFKNDDEFPGIFGSILGGSALKFGVYRSASSGIWITGSPQKQREISIGEAVHIARRHRDQLVRGAEFLEHFPRHGSDADYAHLQEEMDQLAPDVSDLAWGHKYFSLLYPELLDDFHSPDYQRYNLIRMLQIPPAGNGRYIAAGRFVAVSTELDMHMNQCTRVLNRRTKPPRRYWRIGTSTGNRPRDRWEMMRDRSCVAIGWEDLGDLSHLDYTQASKNALKERMDSSYPASPSQVGRATQKVFNFVTVIKEGDIVVAADGLTVLGIGKVVSPYWNNQSNDFPHRRAVEWQSLEEWKLSTPEGLRTTVHELKNHPENLVDIERHILYGGGIVPLVVDPPSDTTPPILSPPPLTGIAGRVQHVLERKGQVILYGPPGTGKTYWAEIAARELAARTNFRAEYKQLALDQQAQLAGAGNDGFIRLCSFHPAYGYEDFIEGYRPSVVDGQLVFQLRDGIFKQLCHDAENNPERSFYLIIDEINRGDIPRIFGELLTILEKNKRGKHMVLPLSGEAFAVPTNVFVIGTMNTADRSIALLDAALRRRFGFIELLPDSGIFGDAGVGSIPLGPWLKALNRRIVEHIGRDARHLQVGHSYFLEGERPVSDVHRFTRILREDVIPLLEEYSYEDFNVLHSILGSDLVDLQRQEIRHELLDGGHEEELIPALLAIDPDIMTSPQAAAVDAAAEAIKADEEEDDDGVDAQ